MSYIKYLLMSLLLICSSQAFAMKTWILMGDSIMSAVSPATINVPLGSSKQLTAFLLMNEKNFSIRNISSPGISFGHADFTGWRNKTKVTDTLG